MNNLYDISDLVFPGKNIALYRSFDLVEPPLLDIPHLSRDLFYFLESGGQDHLLLREVYFAGICSGWFLPTFPE